MTTHASIPQAVLERLGPQLHVADLHDEVRRVVRSITRQRVDKKTGFLYEMLLASFLRQNTHDAPIRLGDTSSFAATRLRTRFGGHNPDRTTHRPAYYKYLEPYWDFDTANEGYDRDAGLTKRYTLRPSAVTIIGAALEGAVSVIDRHTGARMTPQDFPANGISNTSYSTIQIPAIAPLDAAGLSASRASLKDELDRTYGGRHRVTTLDRYVQVATAWQRAIGGIPNLYADFAPGDDSTSGHGRLFGIGSFHLQGMPREVRRLILTSHSQWDYDFNNSNLSILLALAAQVGTPATLTAEYCSDRQGVREMLAKDCESSTRRVKKSLLALVYGAPLSAHRQSAIGGILGESSAGAFAKHRWVTRFANELTTLSRSVLAWLEKGGVLEAWDRHGIRNAVGKVQPFAEIQTTRKGNRPERQVSESRLLSHVVTGYEAWILNAVVAGRDDVVGLMFDGWTGGEANTPDIESLIAQLTETAFGFPILMTLSRVSPD